MSPFMSYSMLGYLRQGRQACLVDLSPLYKVSIELSNNGPLLLSHSFYDKIPAM